MAVPAKQARVALSPPEATYYNEIKYSVGNDPLVRVAPLCTTENGSFIITLRVRGLQKAQALATLLVLNKTFGSTRVKVKVKTFQGRVAEPIRAALKPREIARLYRTAFRTNRLFNFAATRAVFGITYVYPVFKAKVIQFYNDDLSDFYGNYNNAAAFAFRDVLRNTIQGTTVQFSTALVKREQGAAER
ncbi:hypothetical protein DVH26_00345 [Paenibacillus sp. H1-7]|uniref:hypothetical protein n=1 Tax=Paenibacillus sp. H1-7 TaxID=2282849 RepID=UPI001EF84FDF|nr:hypothetical protein [Paenibacillus sp. H1-7]ULL13058.1 hypothetical protein DVH26_00345 [Paenibacillus sp. H1-7]